MELVNMCDTHTHTHPCDINQSINHKEAQLASSSNIEKQSYLNVPCLFFIQIMLFPHTLVSSARLELLLMPLNFPVDFGYLCGHLVNDFKIYVHIIFLFN